MTDTFGSEPHDPDTDTNQDTETVRELPSEDEFSDLSPGLDEHKAPPARRSPILPIAVAVGGVFLLGAVAWWQFGGNTSINGLTADSLSLPQATDMSLNKPALPPLEVPSVAPKTSLTETPKESDVLAPPPPSLEAIQTPDAVPVPPNAPLITTVTPMGVPGAAAPSGPSVPVPLASAPVPVAPAPAEAIPAQPESLESLKARVENLQKAIDTISGVPSVSPDTAVPSNVELLERIDKLEQRLSTLNGTRAASGASAEPKKASKPKTTRAEAPKKVVSGLVLRAAADGQAWVSKSASSTDLKEVQVGDKLPGIGRVTEIKLQGDKWVVHGTKGILQ